MKKRGILIAGIIIVVIVVFTIFAVLGGNDANEEKELANKNISNPVEFSGNISDILKNDDLLGKHIVVSDKVHKVESNDIVLQADDFEVKAYCENIPNEVVENSMISIDGVCTYASSNRIRMRMGSVIDIQSQPNQNEIKVTESDIEDKKSSEESEPIEDSETKDSSPVYNEEDLIKRIEKAYRKKCVNKIEYEDGTLTCHIYFKRYNDFQLEKWKNEALVAAWASLQGVHLYFTEIKKWDSLQKLAIIICFPDDGKDCAGEWEFRTRFTQDELKLIDFTEDDFTQVGTCSYDYGWNNHLRIDDYEYKEFEQKRYENAQ